MSIAPELLERLSAIVDHFAPEFQVAGQEDLQRVLRAGVRTRDDLLALPADEQSDVDDRALACWFLGRLEERAAIPVLLGSLGHREPRLRQAAARALEELHAQEAVPALLQLLSQEPDPDVRRAVVYALGHLGDARALAPLAGVLGDPRQPAPLRGMAAEALGDLGDPAALGPLIDALSDADPEVRLFAAFALGGLGDPWAIPGLERLVASDEAEVPGYSTVREEAANSIDAIRAHCGTRRKG